jgi:predicted nucleotidyltransferase
LTDVRLFGSRARGDNRDDSDYDVVIIVPVIDEDHEQEVTASCAAPEVDLFFLRPTGLRPGMGRLRRWGDPPPNESEVLSNEEIALVLQDRARAVGLAHGLITDETITRALQVARPL